MWPIIQLHRHITPLFPPRLWGDDRQDAHDPALRSRSCDSALCRMVPVSDVFTPNGHTSVQVIWTLSVKRIDERSCEYKNSVVVHLTAEFMESSASISFVS
jgi:hypothetical protein